MRIRVSTQDEFLLNRLLDGDLDADQEAMLRRRLEAEPDLKAAYDRLVRLEAALRACRDSRPQFDQAAFHERLMQAVAAERSPAVRVFRIPSPLWALVPLAAAAAIALLVWSRVPGDIRPLRTAPLAQAPQPPAPAADETVPGERGPAPDAVVSASDAVADAPAAAVLAVRFVRPAEAAGSGATSGAIEVRFARSQELADRVRARDAAELAVPSNFVYIAGVNRDEGAYRALLDAAAL